LANGRCRRNAPGGWPVKRLNTLRPRDIIDLLLTLLTVLHGRNVQVMNGVEQALARP
jgi:hypothetical protein